jgi:hypothetical protein
MHVLFALAIATHTAHAQEAPDARLLFEEANALMDEGRFPEATERLERALALEPRPAIANNLAIARRATGDAIAAAAILAELLEGRFGELSEDRRAVVSELRASVEREIATLQVTVATLAELRLDGLALGWVEGETSHRVNAGAHVVRARTDDGREAERRIEVSAGEVAAVRLELPHATAPRIDRDEPAPIEEESSSAIPWILGIGGAVVAAGIAVLVIALATQSPGVESPFPPVVTP